MKDNHKIDDVFIVGYDVCQQFKNANHQILKNQIMKTQHYP